MTDHGKPPPLDDLEARLKAAQARRHGGRDDKAEDRKNKEFGAAARVGVDLVAGIGVGAVIGWALDRWLGTQPWLMIVFFILGAAAGFRNVYRSARVLAGVAPADKTNSDGAESRSHTKQEE